MSTESTSGISRRTLAKGAAWAVPAVAVTAAAPVYAVSGTVTFNNLNLACKLPGASCQQETGVSKGYVVAMEVCNTVTGNPGNITVTFDEPVTGTLCGTPQTWTIEPNPLILTQGGCNVVNLALDGEPNSANCAIEGTTGFSWVAANGLTGTGTLEFSADATPPCDDCAPPAPGARIAAAAEESPTASPDGADAEAKNVQQVAPEESAEEVAAERAVPSASPDIVESPSSEPVLTETATAAPTP